MKKRIIRISILAGVFVVPNFALLVLLLARAREPLAEALLGAIVAFPYLYSLLLATPLGGGGTQFITIAVLLAFALSCAFSHKKGGLISAIALILCHWLLTSITILVLALGGIGST